jgi:hypothetical protein
MSTLNNALTLHEATDIILALGPKGNVVIVRGEMGIGKTSIYKTLQKHYPKSPVAFFDIPNVSEGDLLMPYVYGPDGRKMTGFAPNATFRFDQPEPPIIVWDEIGKGSEEVRRMVRRVWLEKAIGDFKLPEGTIQFVTTNLAEEGMGDELMPHQANSVCEIEVRKPTAEEWTLQWAMDSGVHPTILATVREFPQMFASFKDYDEPGTNPYIYDPRQPVNNFVSPRSAAFASDALWHTDGLPINLRTQAVAGYVGQRAAADIMAIDQLYTQLPRKEDVFKNPGTAKIPTNAAAVCMVVFRTIQDVQENKELTQAMKYIQRLNKEPQALFATTMFKTGKGQLAASNKEFDKWAGDNLWLTN